MYIAMAVVGILLIIIGYLMPYKGTIRGSSIIEEAEDSSIDVSSTFDAFGLQLLEKQSELTNKRIDILNERIIKLEDTVVENAANMHMGSHSKPELYDNNSYLQENNIAVSQEEEHVSTNDINSAIYNMYDNGASLDEISSALRIGRGELQLRLGLRKSQRN